ncbi:MAG: 5'-3' exonuclease [Actinomycetota bacterium]|nr:5'-3' exonuclease [Actinomycetota bacterium]
MAPQDRPILALDSASLYYRSFHALPESMTAPDGRPHNAVRGFLATVSRLVAAHRPAEVVACWDENWRPDWRVELMPSYKAHRVADAATGQEQEPESLGDQAEAIADLLDAAGIPRLGFSDFEADDVIGSLAALDPRRTIAVSGDRDLVQIVDERTRLLLTVNGGMEKWPLLDPASVLERYGVPADRYVDLAVLRGDPSDGLPGVPGIGAKTAAALVHAFGPVDAIMAAADEAPDARPMTPRLAAALLASRDEVAAALIVARVRTDLPVLDRSPAVDRDALEGLAERWGVQRQVADLMSALARHTEAE